MTDPQTQIDEVTLDKPIAGTKFKPVGDVPEGMFDNKMSDQDFAELLKKQKPKTVGEAAVIGMSQYMLDQKKNYQGIKNNEQVSNRMIAQSADKLNKVNTQQVPIEDDKAAKDLAKRQAEFERDLYADYSIPEDQRHEGSIVKMPKGMRSDYVDHLGMKNPAWTREYVQLRKDPDTGKLSWQGYNKPSVIRGESDITMFSTRFKDEGFTEQVDDKTGLKSKVPTKEVQAFWDKQATDKDYSEEATRATNLLRNMEASGNYRVSKMMASNPELWKNFKAETGFLTGQDLNEGGAMQAADNAIMKTFEMDTPLSKVAPHYAPWAIMDAIDKHNQFAEYTDKYNQDQDNISAKLRLAGEPSLYQKMPEAFDRLHEIEAQMMRDPKSVSPADQKQYNAIKLELTKHTLETMKDSPLSAAFKMKAAEYKVKNDQHLKDIELLGTPDGQAALSLLSKQAKGYEMSQRLPDYFPGMKQAEKEQKAIDEKGDYFSSIKTFLRGVRNSTESIRSGIMRDIGFTEDQIGKEISGEKKSELDLRTPIRAGKTAWEKLANFSDGLGEMAGGLAPVMAMTMAVGGGSISGTIPFILREGVPFFLQGQNDYYREARANGLDNVTAHLKGILGGSALVLSQSILPKGKLLDHGVINKEIEEVIKKGVVDKSALESFYSKFISPGIHATGAGAAITTANGMADWAMNSYINMQKGTKLPADQLEPGKISESALMFGVMGSIMNGVSSFGDKSAARSMVLKMAEDHPLTTLRAIDDAITISKTDASYNETALQRMKKDVSEAIQMSYPESFTKEQRIATFDLIKKKEELQQEQSTVGSEFKGSFEQKIKAIDDKIKEVADKPESAQKHLDEVSDPLYKKLESEGYFDVPSKKEEKKAEDQSKKEAAVAKSESAPVLIRHGETDSNKLGLTGAADDPLNEKGKVQAEKLGEELAASGIKNVVTSPMTRAQETAEAIVGKTGGEVVTNDKLAEWNTGADKTPISEFDTKYWVNHPDEAPPGGESFNQFKGRVQSARDEISGLNKETAVVTHGKVLKMMDALDHNNGEWNEKAKAEFLKDKDFENATPYKDGKKFSPEKVEVEKTIDDKIQEKHGRTPEEIIKQMKEEGSLKIKCPPGSKRKMPLREIVKS